MENGHIFLAHAALSSCVIIMYACEDHLMYYILILYSLGTLVIYDIFTHPGMLSGDFMFNYIP